MEDEKLYNIPESNQYFFKDVSVYDASSLESKNNEIFKITSDGEIIVNNYCNLTDVSKLFWKSIEQFNPAIILKDKIQCLEDELEVYKEEVTFLTKFVNDNKKLFEQWCKNMFIKANKEVMEERKIDISTKLFG